MRSVFTAFLLFTAVSCAHAADVELTRVWPAWRSAESFDRISEYFDGQENTGRHTVLRTQPAARAGYYFLIRAKAAATTSGAKFVLQIITPEAPEPKTYTFPITLGSKETVFDVGLTGPDWAGRKTHAVAWRLSVINAEGRELASQQSFLWSNPAP
jgi:hypothetical protein